MAEISFRRVAILPDLKGRNWRDWMSDAEDLGADAFYFRDWKNHPERIADFIQREDITSKMIFPFALHGLVDHPRAIHFSSTDPFHPLPGVICGRSCHNLPELTLAWRSGFDYTFYSPIFNTATHPEWAPLGLSQLERACKSVGIPVFALGGVDAGNAKQCLDAGAFGIASIRMFVR